ncbi:hypothetical protein BASA50_001207 [Batrachochytrium salamandrivorans]|uniref:Rad21/Rec8-like protein N-terminal domain-containing protein n=1 Tax=Batrachochytrium salamandrivorans TaxID=1357716 RepID=A0ABQ8ERY3_9FUNG|nr:hypothetical protein BASA50_001207 [Batrachochytrium salamandrivorans]
MFFTHDILLRHSGNRKQNSLAVVWLAATLGQRNAYKKLGRKEVNGVDLIQTCIVFGADNQYAQLKPNDGGRPSLCAPDKLLLCVIIKLKRAFSSLQPVDIDLEIAQVRPEHITIDAGSTDMMLLPEFAFKMSNGEIIPASAYAF